MQASMQDAASMGRVKVGVAAEHNMASASDRPSFEIRIFPEIMKYSPVLLIGFCICGSHAADVTGEQAVVSAAVNLLCRNSSQEKIPWFERLILHL